MTPPDEPARTELPNGILSREDIAEREDQLLAPYAMKAKNTRGRVHDEQGTKYRGATRGVYQRDRDRIIHCTAFRRLEYKTQVFVNHEGDNYRTRLTHTLEVAQIARGIARALRLNEDLTEAVALAHDLGHTPFGHSGEDALHELMGGHGGFEHNTHGLRIVDRLEHRYPNFPGLNLTHEVRESIAKHTTSYDAPSSTEFDPNRQALLEGQVVDAADEIAFDNHDIEDGLRAGVITSDQLGKLELWREASGYAEAAFEHLGRPVRPTQVITFLIHILTIDLLEHAAKQIREAGLTSAEDVQARGERPVSFSPSMKPKKEELEAFLFENELFQEYTREPNQLPPHHQARIEEETAGGLNREDALHRVVCDYIAGMTDRYAQEEWKRLFYPFERV